MRKVRGLFGSGEDLFDHMAMYISKSKISALKGISKFFMIDS